MDKKELNQLYYLNKEIAMWEKELKRLDSMSLLPSSEITGMPFVKGGKSDKTGNVATTKADIKNTIEQLKVEAEEKRVKIIEYIKTIDDSLIKQIMLNRHAECMGWAQVAKAVGGHNTAESVRKIHDRFLEEK